MSIGSLLTGPRVWACPGRIAAMAAALLICMASAPASAQGVGVSVVDTRVSGTKIAGTSVSGTSVLEAADHAELSAQVSRSGVVRIALLGDRIARAIRSGGRLEIEHDPASGDLYLRPLEVAGGGVDRTAEAGPAPEAKPEAASAVLFVGTEKGFTYRLTLVPVAGGPAQILIRNPAAGAAATDISHAAVDQRIGALVRLVRAVARRAPLAGYAIHAGSADAGTGVSGTSVSGLTVIEIWRGTGAFPRQRFSALVFEADPSASGLAEGAAGLAGDTRAGDGARLAALWLAAPGTGPSGGRLAVAVVEDAPAGAPRHAGDIR